MSYIGKSPQIGGYHKLDAITTDGSASYTMQLDSANFVPESANHLIVSVNGVIQAPTDSFTVSGSTITFASSLSVSDTIDFIMALGNTLDIGVPSDSTVSLSKLTATGTKDSTTFLRGDNTFAVPSGETNTPAFQATLSGANQSVTDNVSTKVTFNSEDFDTDNAYDHTTNYRFTPQVAGKYYVYLRIGVNANANSELNTIFGQLKRNGSEHENSHFSFATNYARFGTVNINTVVTLNGSSDYIEGFIQASDQSGNASVESGVYTVFGAYRIIE